MFDPVPLALIDDGDDILIRAQQAGIEPVIHMDGVWRSPMNLFPG
jgi:hypothetical protein